MLKKNPYVLKQFNPEGDLVIVDMYHNSILKADREKAVAFSKAIDELDGESDILDVLMEKKILYRDEETHIKGYDELYDEFLRLRSEELHLILLPTEGCNFRCMYCYESHDNHVMSKELQDSIVSFVKKNIQKYKAVRIEWFGGEPLCQVQIVDSLTEQIRAVCKEAKKPFLASMTTNGYLLDLETCKRMIRKNKIVSYQITLDGLADTHNVQRPLANKEGTFDTVLHNLQMIRDNVKSQFFQITIRCNITKKVMEHFGEYLDLLYKEFGGDNRFTFSWKIAWEPENKTDEKYCEESEFGKTLSLAKDRKMRLDFIRGSLTRYGRICYASFPGCFVIGADGTVYKCTVEFDAPENQIGKLGQDGIMEIDERKRCRWDGKVEADDLQKCKECSNAPACMGISCRRSCKNKENQIVCPDYFSHLESMVNIISNYEEYVEMIGV